MPSGPRPPLWLARLASPRSNACSLRRENFSGVLFPAPHSQEVLTTIAGIPLRSFVRPTRRLSRARSARDAVVFLFEDLHWFDRVSEAFLENMVDAAPGNRSLLAVSDDRPRRNRGHWLASGRLETAALEVFRLNAEFRKRETPGVERWLVARG